MRKLIRGIVDFRKNTRQDYCGKFSQLAIKQSPDALLVACCDSRVVPNVFASSNPGDVFVLRNIGNLIPTHQHIDVSVSSAIEFSLRNLKVKDIIICGHSECGAMESLLKHHSLKYPTTALDQWLAHAQSSYERFTQDNRQDATLTPSNTLSRINVLQQLDNLMTYPLVKERVQNNQLGIHGWWFDLSTADVYHYDPLSQQFILIDETGADYILSALVK